MAWSDGDLLTPANLNAKMGGSVFNVKDEEYGAVGDGSTDDRAAVVAADTAADSAGFVYFPAGTYSIASNLTIASPVQIDPGAKLKPASGVTVTIGGPVQAGLWQIFDVSASGTISFTEQSNPAHPHWWGFSASATEAVNATALQAAIDSEAPVIQLPNGGFNYSTGLTIDRAIRVVGSGSCEAAGNSGGQPGTATTQLIYTGSGVGITLVGSGTEGKENLHLSDFSLWGTSSADGGIRAGSSVLVTKSSLKNIHIRGFTKTDAYGLRISKCLETIFENVYTQSNYDGIVNLAGDVSTTIRVVNCHSRTNTRNGTRLAGTLSGSVFVGLLNEGNGSDGLYIHAVGVSGNDFFSYYSEANNDTTGTAPIVITGTSTSPARLHFYGGVIADAVSNTAIALDYAEQILFDNVSLITYNSGFITVTANTSACEFRMHHAGLGGLYGINVTNNAFGRMIVGGPTGIRRFAVTVAGTGGTSALAPIQSGVCAVEDVTNFMCALYYCAGTRNTWQELSDPDAHFTNASGGAGTINLYYSSGYAIQNNTADSVTVVFTVFNSNNF